MRARWGGLISLILLCLAVSACQDPPYYTALYKRYCKEPKTTLNLTKIATCNGEPLLFYMASTNSLKAADIDDIVVYLIQNEFDPNLRDSEGRTPLMVAIDSKNFAFARAIQPYSDLSAKDKNGDTYMHHASRILDARFDSLIDQSTALLVNNQNESPEVTAAKNQNPSYFWSIVLLSGRIDDVGSLFSSAGAPLLFSVKLEQRPNALDAFSAFLDTPFSGKFYDDGFNRVLSVKNYSLIHFAAEHGLPHLTQYLIHHGACLSCDSSEGAPLALAARTYVESKESPNLARSQKTVEALLNSIDATRNSTILGAVIHTLNITWIRRLLDADVGMAPGDLLMSNCGMSAASPSTELTAIYLHYECGNNGVTWKLDDSAVNALGQNEADYALYLFDEKSYDQFAGFFFRNGFDNLIARFNRDGMMNARDDLGMSPLEYWLISPRRGEISDELQVSHLKTLLSYSDDASSVNFNGDSALTYAVESHNFELVKTFIENVDGARSLIKRTNKQGLSPVDLALKDGDNLIYAYLTMGR